MDNNKNEMISLRVTKANKLRLEDHARTAHQSLSNFLVLSGLQTGDAHNRLLALTLGATQDALNKPDKKGE